MNVATELLKKTYFKRPAPRSLTWWQAFGLYLLLSTSVTSCTMMESLLGPNKKEARSGLATEADGENSFLDSRGILNQTKTDRGVRATVGDSAETEGVRLGTLSSTESGLNSEFIAEFPAGALAVGTDVSMGSGESFYSASEFNEAEGAELEKIGDAVELSISGDGLLENAPLTIMLDVTDAEASLMLSAATAAGDYRIAYFLVFTSGESERGIIAGGEISIEGRRLKFIVQHPQRIASARFEPLRLAKKTASTSSSSTSSSSTSSSSTSSSSTSSSSTSSSSTSSSGAVPATPSFSLAAVGPNITLSFDGAGPVEIFHATTPGVTAASTKVDASSSPVIFNSMGTNQTYYFRLRFAGSSALSAEASTKSGPDAPVIYATAQQGSAKAAVQIEPVSGGVSYHLRYRTHATGSYASTNSIDFQSGTKTSDSSAGVHLVDTPVGHQLEVAAFAVNDVGTPSLAAKAPLMVRRDDLQFEVGLGHGCFVQQEKLFCYGDNGYGQLGRSSTQTNTYENVADAQEVVTGFNSAVRSVSAAYHASCAVSELGEVKCWGYNYQGMLGRDSTQNFGDDPSRSVAAMSAVVLPSPVKEISAAQGSVCVIYFNGKFSCWGNGADGRLGEDSTTNRGDGVGGAMADITEIDLGEPAVKISGQTATRCALTEAGKLKCWGENLVSEAGIADNVASIASGVGLSLADAPFLDFGLDGSGDPRTVVEMAMGHNHGCAILSDDKLKCWGQSNYGSLGLNNNETEIGRADANQLLKDRAPVSGIGTGLLSVAVGSQFSCVVSSIGLKCFGLGDYNGQGITIGQTASASTDLAAANTTGFSPERVYATGQNACYWKHSDKSAVHTGYGDSNKVVQMRCWGVNGGALPYGHDEKIIRSHIGGDVKWGINVMDDNLACKDTFVSSEFPSSNNSPEIGLKFGEYSSGHYRGILLGMGLQTSLRTHNPGVDSLASLWPTSEMKLRLHFFNLENLPGASTYAVFLKEGTGPSWSESVNQTTHGFGGSDNTGSTISINSDPLDDSIEEISLPQTQAVWNGTVAASGFDTLGQGYILMGHSGELTASGFEVNSRESPLPPSVVITKGDWQFVQMCRDN